MEKVKHYCGEYVKVITDLQQKYKKDNEKFVLLGLILIFIIDYYTHAPHEGIETTAPFLPKLILDNPTKTAKEIDKGIKGKGLLKNDIIVFKNNLLPLFNYITKTQENLQKPLNSALKENRRIEKLKEETALFEKQNNMSLFVNQMYFNRKFKVWNTQRDDKVRKTDFHKGIDRMRVGINEWFVVGNHQALYPAHSTLYDYDRFNCRCFLTYE